jgi:hypothetical protein
MLMIGRVLLLLLLLAVLDGSSTSALAFSVGNENSSTSRPREMVASAIHNNNDWPVMSRRAGIGAMFTIATAGSFFPSSVSAAAAATAEEECETDCMYKCKLEQQQASKKGKLLLTENQILGTCLVEECKDHQQCQAQPPPGRMTEPRMLQAKDVKGLYPRWQDSF